ncbi:MAG: hypothetical protein ACO2ZP_04955 [Bacteriovoracaceae bacterium]
MKEAEFYEAVQVPERCPFCHLGVDKIELFFSKELNDFVCEDCMVQFYNEDNYY